MSRKVPSARFWCRRSTPSRVAPRLRDRGLRTLVQQVGLQLHPTEPAVVERVAEHEQLALGVDRPPTRRPVGSPADVRPLVDQVPVTEAARADDGSGRRASRRRRAAAVARCRPAADAGSPPRPPPAAWRRIAATSRGPPAGSTAVARRPHPIIVQRREQLRARRRPRPHRGVRGGRPARGRRVPLWSRVEAIGPGIADGGQPAAVRLTGGCRSPGNSGPLGHRAERHDRDRAAAHGTGRAAGNRVGSHAARDRCHGSRLCDHRARGLRRDDGNPRAARPAPARPGRGPARRHHTRPRLVGITERVAGRSRSRPPGRATSTPRAGRCSRGTTRTTGCGPSCPRRRCGSPGRRPAATAGGPADPGRRHPRDLLTPFPPSASRAAARTAYASCPPRRTAPSVVSTCTSTRPPGCRCPAALSRAGRPILRCPRAFSTSGWSVRTTAS